MGWPHARCVTQSRVLALLPGGAAPLHVQAQGPDLGGFLGLLPVPGLESFDLLTLRLPLRAWGQGCHWQLGTPGANVAGSGPPPKLLTVGGLQTGSISTPPDAHLKWRVSGLPSHAESGSRFHKIPGWFMVEKHQVSTFLKITQLIWCKRYF